jgi:hypothetical protein
VQVELRYSSGNYQVRALANTDLIIFTSSTSWYTLSDAEHYFEIEGKAATEAGFFINPSTLLHNFFTSWL